MADRKAAYRAATDDAAGARARKAETARRGRDGVIGLGVLDVHLGYFLRRAQVAVFQDFIETLGRIDVRPAQYSVLAVIAANSDPSQSDVAQLLGIERARLVRLLDRLERRGLLRRFPSSKDRRSHALRLTPAGQRLLKQAQELAAVHEARLMSRLGPERHKLMLEALRNFSF
ncbi:MAG: winged helix-turn-helix transcriptional regulator [Alphaproteobacteria bacterium]|nr:winged helix-turn-helix transcriptional regulator [Alphaproteobacteria bacterium]